MKRCGLLDIGLTLNWLLLLKKKKQKNELQKKIRDLKQTLLQKHLITKTKIHFQ